MSYKEIDLTIPKYLNEDTAIVVSKQDDKEHYGWFLDGKVIAYEKDLTYGIGLITYESLEEYLEDMENTWVLENNETEEALAEVRKKNG